jgi:hypothetical protein
MFFKLLFSILILITNLSSYIIVEHEPLKYFIPNYRIKFNANMKDYYHNFVSAELKFRVSTTDLTAPFHSISMICNSENFCSAISPAPLKETKGIDYFIEAVDRVGDRYKTQNFTIPQITLPSWQIDGEIPIELTSSTPIAKDVSLNGFNEKVQIRYIQNSNENAQKVESKFVPSNEISLVQPENQKSDLNQIKSVSSDSVDLNGVWSIRRTLSTCTSGLYSHKIIKITSFNGKISDSTTLRGGTKFFYSDRDGYICQLVDDISSGALVGESSIYTYNSFFNSLKASLGKGEFVKLLEFSSNKIVFELHMGTKTLTTIYKKEPDNIFF